MRLSVALFGLRPQEYLPVVQHAEAVGLENVWVAEHVVVPLEYATPYPYNPTGDPGYGPTTPLVDVTTMLAYLAAGTERIGLGAGVMVLPMRNPFLVALAWATLQELADGRAVLGVATGWMREEFDAVGAPFDDRGARLDEMAEVLRLLWTGQPVELHGRFHDFPAVQLASAPSVRVPVVVGGHSEPALRRAALLGDGWFAPYQDLETTVRLSERVDALRADAGLSEQPFAHHVRLHGELTRANLDRYREAGYEHVVVTPFRTLGPGATQADRLAAIDVAAELV